jgi:hypothetical protein
MSSPRPAEAVVVRPEAVASLADELSALAAELSEDAEHCRASAGHLSAALDGPEGWTAGAAATAWGGLENLLAEQAAALARVMHDAVQAYLAEDARIAGGMTAGRPRAPR